MATERMIYQTDETRDRIIDAAAALFSRRGLFDIKMTDVAKAADVSRNTLYRYYRDKGDLALEILRGMFKRMAERDGAAILAEAERRGLDGHTTLRLAFDRLWARPGFDDELRFMAEFDAYFSGERLDPAFIERLRETVPLAHNDAMLAALLRGQADGSIRSDREPRLLLVTLINATKALKQRLAIRGDSLVEAAGLDRDAIMKELMDLVFDGLRGR